MERILSLDVMFEGAFEQALDAIATLESEAAGPAPVSLVLMGAVHYGRHEFSESAQCFSDAIRISGGADGCNRANFFTNQAAALFALAGPRELAMALDAALCALRLDANSIRGWYLRGIILRAMDRFGEADAALATAARLVGEAYERLREDGAAGGAAATPTIAARLGAAGVGSESKSDAAPAGSGSTPGGLSLRTLVTKPHELADLSELAAELRIAREELAKLRAFLGPDEPSAAAGDASPAPGGSAASAASPTDVAGKHGKDDHEDGEAAGESKAASVSSHPAAPAARVVLVPEADRSVAAAASHGSLPTASSTAAGALAAAAAAASGGAGAGAGTAAAAEGDIFVDLEDWLLGRPGSSSSSSSAGAAGTSAGPIAPSQARARSVVGAFGAVSSFPALYMKSYGSNGRGVHARCDIGPEREVMAIAREFLITVETAKAFPAGRKLAAANIDNELSAAKHCYLALFVLWDRRNPESFYQPYYRILPQSFPSMPLFWEEDELSHLRGSYFLQQVADRKAMLREDYTLITSLVPEVAEWASLDDFTWARMMVASRNFGITVDGLRTDALVPYADMLNHHRPRQTRWHFDSRRQAFLIISTAKLRAGQQVYDSYGKKCNSRFLLNYGFTVESNVEEDTGQDLNEVRILLGLAKPSEDPWYPAKMRLLGDHPPGRAARISTFYDNEGTVEAFSFARFVTAGTVQPGVAAGAWSPAAPGSGADEIARLPSFTAIRGDIVRRFIPPLSAASEVRALRVIAGPLAEQLRAYPSTLEEDEAELASGRWPYGSNKRNCLVLLRGEKRVCRYYIALAALAEHLAGLPSAEAARAEAERLKTADGAVPAAVGEDEAARIRIEALRLLSVSGDAVRYVDNILLPLLDKRDGNVAAVAATAAVVPATGAAASR